MERFAFISRHTPTEEQAALAAQQGIVLVPVGDHDAFGVWPEWVESKGTFAGVVVVHPAAAMRLFHCYRVAVFRNGQRSVEGGPATFFPVSFHVFPSMEDIIEGKIDAQKTLLRGRMEERLKNLALVRAHLRRFE